jgi:hypothetical protein
VGSPNCCHYGVTASSSGNGSFQELASAFGITTIGRKAKIILSKLNPGIWDYRCQQMSFGKIQAAFNHLELG